MEENVGIWITGAVGLATTIVGAWASWFFARKKYNSEVDNNLIRNMQESLEFYKQLSDDTKSRLDEVLKRNLMLEEEVSQLRGQVFELMSHICYDASCQARKITVKETRARKKSEKKEVENEAEG